jgi:hypothetical protein
MACVASQGDPWDVGWHIFMERLVGLSWIFCMSPHVSNSRSLFIFTKACLCIEFLCSLMILMILMVSTLVTLVNFLRSFVY